MAQKPTAQGEMKVSAWFTEPTAEQVARKLEVWTLLEWYHKRYVVPNLGLRGVIRRLWARFFGKKIRNHKIELIAMLSPWEEIRVKAQVRELMKQLEAARLQAEVARSVEDGAPQCPDVYEGEEFPRAQRCELSEGHKGLHYNASSEWAWTTEDLVVEVGEEEAAEG